MALFPQVPRPRNVMKYCPYGSGFEITLWLHMSFTS